MKMQACKTARNDCVAQRNYGGGEKSLAQSTLAGDDSYRTNHGARERLARIQSSNSSEISG